MLVTLSAMIAVSIASAGYLLLSVQPQVDRYSELTRHSRLLHIAMLDQETGLRGWLATGDATFLAPYQSGREAADETSRKLVAQGVADPDIAAGIVDTMVARAAWEMWAQEAADLVVGADDRTDGHLKVFLLEGKELFDEFRLADERGTTPIVALRDRAIDHQRWALVGVLGTYVLVTAVAAERALRRRRQLATTVLGPIEGLLTTIDALRAGDLAARPTATGVTELDAMGSALGALADELGTAQHLAVERDRRLSLLASRLEAVVRVAREVSGSLSVRYVSETVASAAADLLDAPVTLWVRAEDGPLFAARRSADPHGNVPPSDLAVPRLVAVSLADARATSDESARAYPLVLGGMVVGVREVATPTVGEEADHVLQALLSTAAAALESARMHSAVRELADMDALTQLPNRRRLEADLQTEWDRSRRYGRPLSFVMVDLDHFKRLNDEHGHPVGDTVLHAAAGAVQATLRATDTAYRYGGEEIAVMLRETDLDAATSVAERIRSAVGAVTLTGSAVRVTASLGVAERASEMRLHTELVAAADAALYAAKRTGRDRVVAHAVAPSRPSPADPAPPLSPSPPRRAGPVSSAEG